MTKTGQALGLFGEDVAARLLEEQGMVIIDRRWRCRHGEIDLVARDGRCLVFVEVKVRTSMALGGPLAAVTPAKVRRLRLLVGAWLAAHDEHAPEVRIDVVGVLRAPTLTVEHVRQVG